MTTPHVTDCRICKHPRDAHTEIGALCKRCPRTDEHHYLEPEASDLLAVLDDFKDEIVEVVASLFESLVPDGATLRDIVDAIARNVRGHTTTDATIRLFEVRYGVAVSCACDRIRARAEAHGLDLTDQALTEAVVATAEEGIEPTCDTCGHCKVTHAHACPDAIRTAVLDVTTWGAPGTEVLPVVLVPAELLGPDASTEAKELVECIKDLIMPTTRFGRSTWTIERLAGFGGHTRKVIGRSVPSAKLMAALAEDPAREQGARYTIFVDNGKKPA